MRVHVRGIRPGEEWALSNPADYMNSHSYVIMKTEYTRLYLTSYRRRRCFSNRMYSKAALLDSQKTKHFPPIKLETFCCCNMRILYTMPNESNGKSKQPTLGNRVELRQIIYVGPLYCSSSLSLIPRPVATPHTTKPSDCYPILLCVFSSPIPV